MFPWCKRTSFELNSSPAICWRKEVQLYQEAVLSPIDKNVGLNVKRTRLNRTEAELPLHMQIMLAYSTHKSKRAKRRLAWNTSYLNHISSYQHANETNSPQSITHWGCIVDEWVACVVCIQILTHSSAPFLHFLPLLISTKPKFLTTATARPSYKISKAPKMWKRKRFHYLGIGD